MNSRTIGRAARNEHGKVVLYADQITRSMQVAIDETERRRRLQKAYNEAHGIVPKTVRKDVRSIIEIGEAPSESEEKEKHMTARERLELIASLEKSMKEAAKLLDFEYAAELRDRIIRLRGMGQKKGK